VVILLFTSAYFNQLIDKLIMIHHIMQADDRGTAVWTPPHGGSLLSSILISLCHVAEITSP
jgi:hypothetical protein